MRILVVAPSWIGDTIMMQPLLMRLKAQHPACEIHVLAPAWSAPLLARMAEVSAVFKNPFGHGVLDIGERRALGRHFKKAEPGAGYARAYVLPNTWKSALVPFFADIPERIGYTGEARYLLLNRRHRLDAAAVPRLVDRYAALAGPADGPGDSLRPHLSSTPEQQHVARAALGLPADGTPVVFCPGAEYGPAKRWPARHFAALAQKVGTPRVLPAGRAGDTATAGSAAGAATPVWIVGSDKDASVGEEIASLANGPAINLCGRTTLEQAIDLIASARAVVSNDSGLMHVAAALDRPLVALYGSSSPAYTPPLSPQAKIISLGLACSPCFKRECPLAAPGTMRCLDGIAPEQVLAALPA